MAVVELGLAGTDAELPPPSRLSEPGSRVGELVLTLVAAHLGAEGRLPGARRSRAS